MKRKLLLFLVMMLLNNVSAYAAREFTVKNQDKLNIILSETDVNRIAIVNDRIKAVYGSQDKVHIVTDEENGQIFVTPKAMDGASFSLSLVTESNATIDLKVTPVKKASETLLLKLNNKTKKEVSKEEALRSLIKAAFNGEDIEGYKNLEGKDEKDKGLIQRKVYSGQNYMVSLFEYKNSKESEEVLSEQRFKSAKSIAVAIEKKDLKPGETTRIVIVENVKR